MRWTAMRLLPLILILSGCVTAEYFTPDTEEVASQEKSRVLDADFATVWQALIDYSTESFFSISNIERDSGFVAAEFSASNPSEYVDGGLFTPPGMKHPWRYVDYMRENYSLSLDGKINFNVQETQEGKTRVAVHALYVVVLPTSHRVDVVFETQITSPGTTWKFNSGGYSTQVISGNSAGTSAYRTFMPTGELEKQILDGIAQNL